MTTSPSASDAAGPMTGRSSPVRITSATCSSSLRPSAPPGCERAKSCEVKPRASSRATASASPIASVAVVLAVGARLSGQASSATLTSRWTVAARARFDFALPVMAMMGTPRRDEVRNQQQHFGGFAGIGDGQQHVVARDHADVAMAGFGRMHEERRRAGGGERGGDLAGDVAGFAHAADDDPAVAFEADAAGARETRVEPRHQRRDGPALDLESPASGGDQRGRIGLELGIHAAIITLKITR